MPHAATQMARITVSVKEASSGTVSGVQILMNVLHLAKIIAALMPHVATQMVRMTVRVTEASLGMVSIVQIKTNALQTGEDVQKLQIV